MTDPKLLDYIKQNLKAGFREKEIRQTLSRAGWNEGEITEAFHAGSPLPAKPTGRPITKLVALLLILTFGGFATYQKFLNPRQVQVPNQTSKVQGEQTSAEASEHDRKRVTDIQTIQDALDAYFEKNQTYPKRLSYLVKANLLPTLPLDPKTNDPYNYTAVGEPALYYSLPFLLETGIGTLESGLEVATSENQLSAPFLEKQEKLLRGEDQALQSTKFSITNLSDKQFQPQQEIHLTAEANPNLEIKNVVLVIDDLKLVDKKWPFEFQFTAPKKPGQYRATIFGFSKSGANFSASTTLEITEQH